jgi:uncharacterized membrane protein YqaE (UPF0057 family)
MKYSKILLIVFLFTGSIFQLRAAENVNGNEARKTAISVFEQSLSMEKLDVDLLKKEIKGLSFSEKRKLVKLALTHAKSAKIKEGDKKASIALIILAIILPPVAVAIYTNLGMPTLWNLLWCCCGYLPGPIHAVYVLTR